MLLELIMVLFLLIRNILPRLKISNSNLHGVIAVNYQYKLKKFKTQFKTMQQNKACTEWVIQYDIFPMWDKSLLTSF